MNKFFTILFLLLFSSFSFAKGPVWHVTNGKNEIYLGGTIHLLAPNDYPLPLEFEEGYKNSDILAFEINPELAASPQTQQLFMQYALYNDGRTLSTVLNKKTYDKLNNYLKVRGMTIESFAQIKPAMLSVMLSVIELQRLGVAGIGVDEHFSRRAKQDAKQRFNLETIEQQFEALLKMGKGKENEVILQTISEAERIKEILQQTKAAWRSGDNEALMAVALKPWMRDFPEIYDSLLVERNLRWIPQLEEYLKTPEVEFVLVGALHMVGPDGVLALLESKGYQVKQL